MRDVNSQFDSFARGLPPKWSDLNGPRVFVQKHSFVVRSDQRYGADTSDTLTAVKHCLFVCVQAVSMLSFARSMRCARARKRERKSELAWRRYVSPPPLILFPSLRFCRFSNRLVVASILVFLLIERLLIHRPRFSVWTDGDEKSGALHVQTDTARAHTARLLCHDLAMKYLASLLDVTAILKRNTGRSNLSLPVITNSCGNNAWK